MLEKFKERKQNAVTALRDALDAVFLCLPAGIAEIMDNIAEGAKNKNPNARQETMMLLTRCLQVTKKVPGKTEVKALCEMLVKVNCRQNVG